MKLKTLKTTVCLNLSEVCELFKEQDVNLQNSKNEMYKEKFIEMCKDFLYEDGVPLSVDLGNCNHYIQYQEGEYLDEIEKVQDIPNLIIEEEQIVKLNQVIVLKSFFEFCLKLMKDRKIDSIINDL